MLIDQSATRPIEVLHQLLANEIVRMVRRDDVVEVRVAILGRQGEIAVGERELERDKAR